MSVAGHIARARGLMEQPGEAVAALLDAWRLCRDPEIAGLVEEFGLRVPQTPFELRKRRSWDDILDRKPREHVVDLLAAVSDHRRPWRTERIVRLVELAPDPRVIRAMKELVEIADEEDRPAIRKRIAELDELPKALDDDARSQLDALVTEWDARAREERALIDEVFANPEDDGPRHIYGDWLQQHGDPRGDLLAVQVRRTIRPRDQDARTNEKKLLELYSRVWLGTLRRPNVIVDKYERGFVSAISLWNSEVLALTGLREWSTVRELKFWPQPDLPREVLLRFLGHDVMRALRSIGFLSIDELVAISKLPALAGLEQVTIVGGSDPGAAPNLSGLPSLVRLVAQGPIDWLVRSDLRERVQNVSGTWANLRGIGRELMDNPCSLEELQIDCGFDVRFVRGEHPLSKLIVKRTGAAAESSLAAFLRVVPDRLVGEYAVEGEDRDGLVRVIRQILRLRK